MNRTLLAFCLFSNVGEHRLKSRNNIKIPLPNTKLYNHFPPNMINSENTAIHRFRNYHFSPAVFDLHFSLFRQLKRMFFITFFFLLASMLSINFSPLLIQLRFIVFYKTIRSHRHCMGGRLQDLMLLSQKPSPPLSPPPPHEITLCARIYGETWFLNHSCSVIE